jgi:hypothetical protein
MNYLYLDIETVPDTSRAHLWGLPEAPEMLPLYTEEPEALLAGTVGAISAFLKTYGESIDLETLEVLGDFEAHTRDRVGVHKAIGSAMAASGGLSKRLSLDPELCRIVAIGTAVGDGVPVAAIPSADGEGAALSALWGEMAYKPGQDPPITVGYNVLGFDIPVILARSILLGVKPSRPISLRKWGNRDAIDIMYCRFPFGKYKPLKVLSEQYGIGAEAPGMDGSMVAYMDKEELAKYVISDILLVRELHRRFQGYFC